VYLNVGFTGLFLASSTHLMVSSGVKRATLGERPLRNQQMTTDRAEGLLAEFTCFRGPITAAWAHRWAHAAGLALVVFAYLLVTVCDVSRLPLGLLIFLALVLSTLNSYLILLLGINYTWAKLLDGLRRASGEWKDERISQGGKQGLRLTRSFTTRTRAIHQRFHRQR
jgi:hypothetical protein